MELQFSLFFFFFILSFRSVYLFGDTKVIEFKSSSGNKEVESVEPHEQPSPILTSEVKKRSAHPGVLSQCEGLLSVEYCICKYCGPTQREKCIQQCQSKIKYEVDQHPLDHFHALEGKVLNQSECWVCSHVPQRQDNIGVVPIPLNATEVLRLREGRPTEEKYNTIIRQYSADRSLLCFNVTNNRGPGYWEVVWSNQTMAYSVKADGELILTSRVNHIKNTKGYQRSGWWNKSKKTSLGNVHPGYCSVTIQDRTCTEQLGCLGKGGFTKSCNICVTSLWVT